MSRSTRSLRPRSSRPSYSQYLEDNGEDDEGTGQNDSSDEFEPEDEAELKEDDGEEDLAEDEDGAEDDAEGEVDEDVSAILATPTSNPQPNVASSSKAKIDSALEPSAKRKTHFGGASRHNYAKPAALLPNVDHRHRAQPLYRTQNLIERLATPPPAEILQLGPFEDRETKQTKNWTWDSTISERFSKASGHNVGPGPIWEFMEDRSWWKESLRGDMAWTEAFRRPRVYADISVGERWTYLDEKNAVSFLPKDGAQPLACWVGPVEELQLLNLKIFDSLNLSTIADNSLAVIFNAGAPVFSVDWCPIFSEDRPARCFKQYLAVAPLPSKGHTSLVGVKCMRPSEACIQIWALRNPLNASVSLTCSEMRCELVLGIDCGPAQALQWCPLPSNDPWLEQGSSDACRKLGILGGTFEDGSFGIFIVPDPEDVQNGETLIAPNPPVVKIEPAIRIELEDTSCLSLAWANSTRFAIGCSNGSVAVYDLNPDDLRPQLGKSTNTDLSPSYYVSVHQSAVRSITWIHVPPASVRGELQEAKDPMILATGGFDGCLFFVDLAEGGCAGSHVVNRTRDVLSTVKYSHFTSGVVTTDGESTVKNFSLNLAVLGRGHSVSESNSPIWSIGVSDYHGHVVVGCADGSCSSTNTVRSARRSTSTPFTTQKLFHLDYSRASGEYRLLDHFLPTEVIDFKTAASSKSNKNKKDQTGDTRNPNSGAWPENVAVTNVKWNSGGGLSRAPLLASATASGLCRIDWLLGRFARNHLPYGGIGLIRKEFGRERKENSDVEMDEESD